MNSPGNGGAGAEDERGPGREALRTLKSALYQRLAGENGAQAGAARLKDILAAEFRSNPGYQIIELARLSPTAQERLRRDADADYFGVLSPQAGSDLEIKAVGKDIALLFYMLAEPGGLPDFITKDADEQVNSQIVTLVLDDILQIASGGEFVSGAGADAVLYERSDVRENLGRISRISLDAVLFGQQLPVTDALSLSAQLYLFNSLPITPSLQRCLASEAAVANFLKTDSASVAAVLNAHWNELDRTASTRSWRRFTLRDAGYERPPDTDVYKLYVSPTLESFPDALPTIVDVFAEKRVRYFKIGADLGVLCRPDKIVAEFDSYEQLVEVGRELNERLGDVPAQGVPFTAELCGDGLLSWGVEPHRRPPAVEGKDVSWRRWVTNRLATALLQARDVPGAAVEPWRFALQRVRQEGVDTHAWTPLSGRRRTDSGTTDQLSTKISDAFVLSNDVQMIALNADDGDVVLTSATRSSSVVDGEMAALIGEFGRGATIVDAVLAYCRARRRDPEQTLDAAFPVLAELIDANVLAVAESDTKDRPVFGEAKQSVANRFSQSERLIAHYARRLDPAGAVFEAGLPEPPISSINYGSGGVAYYFYRLAGIRQDAQLLAWAKLWIEKAIRESETKAQLAFWDLDEGLTPETVAPVALYHSPTGLHAVKALIGHAANDHASQMAGLAGFVKAAQLPCDNIDLTLGRSGALLGAALLDEAMPGQPDLRSLGAQLLAQIWGQLDAMPQLAQETRFRYTGIAHGWAGVLYATLCWCAITGAPVPAPLPDRLHQLADLAERWGDGMRWGLLIPSASDRASTDFSAGWCNGTAGMIHLWTRAHETIRDTRFLALADGAARNVIAAPEPIAQLCCGRPGQAYALLNLHNHTGERRWLDHAHKFAEQSRYLSPLPADDAAPPFHYALYKGPLGTALLSADLDDPSEACMPMFESQRWTPA